MRSFEFIIAVLLLELTPGPNMAYLAALSLSRGRRAALAGVLGVALGLTTHAALSALGVGALVAASPLVYETLRWAGVAFMLFLAWEGWRGADDGVTEERGLRSAGQLLLRGFVTNVLNPKSILFFVAVVPGFLVAPGDATARLVVLGAIYVAIATAVHLTIVLLAGAAVWLAVSTGR